MRIHRSLVVAVGLTAGLTAGAFLLFPAVLALLDTNTAEPTPPGTYLLILSFLYALDIAVIGAYLAVSRRGLALLEFRRLSLRDAGYVIATVLVSFVLAVVFSVAVVALALPAPPTTIFQEIELLNPTNLLVFVPFALLVNGPVEEILFRGIVQRSLAADYGDAVAIALASILFAVYHLPVFFAALLTPSPPLAGVTVSLVDFAIAGAVLGVAYTRTRNLTVPALAHGIYNAILALVLYVSLA